MVMQQQAITETALTTEAANEYFSDRIIGNSFRDDVSMLSAARALFDKRLKEGEQIRITVKTEFFSSDLDMTSIVQTAEGLRDGDLVIIGLSTRKEDSGKWMPAVKQILEDAHLYEMDDIDTWMATKGTKTLIYTDKPHDPSIPKSPVDNCKTIVVIENLMMARWRRLGSFLGRFYAKYFLEIPKTEDEAKLILAGISGEDSSPFLNAIRAYADTLDLRSGRIKKLLGDFEVRFAEDRVRHLQEISRDLNTQIIDMSTKIGEAIANREQVETEICGFLNGDKKVEPVTMNYFLSNKNLVLKTVTANAINFYVSSWLSNWDPEKAKATFKNNHCSSWLEYAPTFDISKNDAKLLFDALFVDEIVKVRLWSYYKLSVRGDALVRTPDSACPPDIKNALPNPHHRYNHCLGGNASYINDCIINHNIVGAIEQCISATSGINLTEHASYQYFARDLFNPEFGEVVFVPTLDKFLTAKDAVKWVKEYYAKKKKKEATKDE